MQSWKKKCMQICYKTLSTNPCSSFSVYYGNNKCKNLRCFGEWNALIFTSSSTLLDGEFFTRPVVFYSYIITKYPTNLKKKQLTINDGTRFYLIFFLLGLFDITLANEEEKTRIVFWMHWFIVKNIKNYFNKYNFSHFFQ